LARAELRGLACDARHERRAVDVGGGLVALRLDRVETVVEVEVEKRFERFALARGRRLLERRDLRRGGFRGGGEREAVCEIRLDLLGRERAVEDFEFVERAACGAGVTGGVSRADEDGFKRGERFPRRFALGFTLSTELPCARRSCRRRIALDVPAVRSIRCSCGFR